MNAPACFECGAPPPLHEHHVVPRSRGGTRTVPLCERCHGLVHGRGMNTSALTKEWAASRRSRGLAHGTAPYGYRKDADGKLSPLAETRATVDRVLSLRGIGLSLRAVAAKLTEEGVPSPSGKPWNPVTVSAVERRALTEAA